MKHLAPDTQHSNSKKSREIETAHQLGPAEWFIPLCVFYLVYEEFAFGALAVRCVSHFHFTYADVYAFVCVWCWLPLQILNICSPHH